MQKVILDINPKGDIPFLYFSQYDNKRPFQVELLDGDEAYNVPTGYSVQLNVRKTDSKLVTKAPEDIVGNIISFLTTTQMTACPGNNIASLTLNDENDTVITTLYFIIEVQRDVLQGGLNSASEIHDLEEQIAAIVPEVIGDDYYNKTQVDSLLEDKADVSDLPDMTQYYNKTQVDSLLEDKADVSDLPDMTQYYNKTQVDSLLEDKADVSDLPDMSQYYNKTQVDELIANIFPTFTASGVIASFTTALNKPLVSVTADAAATTITRCGINLWNEDWELGTYDDEGRPTPSNLIIRNKNFIKVPSNGSIYIATPTNGIIFWYDLNKNFISKEDFYNAGVKSVPNNAVWANFRMAGGYGTTYNNDISINYPLTDTEYHAYNGITVSKDQATNIETLSGVNNVFADSGSVTVQYKYMSM